MVRVGLVADRRALLESGTQAYELQRFGHAGAGQLMDGRRGAGFDLGSEVRQVLDRGAGHVLGGAVAGALRTEKLADVIRDRRYGLGTKALQVAPRDMHAQRGFAQILLG